MKTKSEIPQFLTIPKSKYATGPLEISVNGDVKAEFNNLGLCRQIMNDLAVMLIENYYPSKHFVITMSQGDRVLDTIVT